MKILVVDDSRSSRKLVSQILMELGYEAKEASSGHIALAMLELEKFDLITLDVEMPDKDGFVTCAEIRQMEIAKYNEEFSTTPIVFITANDTLDGRKKGFEAGATDFISKSSLIEHFPFVIERLLRSEKRLIGMRALVVDSSIYARRAISASLYSQGVDIHECTDDSEAIEKIKLDAMFFDIIICDLSGSLQSEEDFCKKIRLDFGNKSTPIIILRSDFNKENVFDLFKAGATDFLIKPFLNEELLVRCISHLENKMLANRLRRTLNEMIKMREVQDKFLAVCSHDMRSPLSGIVGLIDFIKEERDSLQRESMLDLIKAQGLITLEMVNNILDLCRSEVLQEDVFNIPQNLVDLILSCVEQQRGLALTKSIELAVEIPEGIKSAMILGNRSALMTILNNLVSNALKFSHMNKSIRISLLEHDSSHWTIQIRDQGIGIPKNERDKFFTKFTGKSRPGTRGEQGSGLGLSVVQEFVSRHSATLELDSEVDSGTTFRIVFSRHA